MIFKVLSAAFIAIFLLVISMVGLQTHEGLLIKYCISSIPFGDKAIHFGLMLVLSFLLYHAFGKRQMNILGISVFFSSLLLAVSITLEECSQLFIPSRNFEILDMVCNYAGIYLGSLLTGLPKLKRLTNADHFRSETLSVQTIHHSPGPLFYESGHGRRTTRRLVRHHGRR